MINYTIQLAFILNTYYLGQSLVHHVNLRPEVLLQNPSLEQPCVSEEAIVHREQIIVEVDTSHLLIQRQLICGTQGPQFLHDEHLERRY